MEPSHPRFKTLFLCTGNYARSIFAEYFLRHAAGGIFDAFSAGLSPHPAPHPVALQVLREDFHIDVTGARSKSWEEFRGVEFDFIITLCDESREACPIWPGQPVIAHWFSPDPSAVQGDEADVRHAFWLVAGQIKRRVDLFASLPLDKLDALRREAETRAIGEREHIELVSSRPV